MRAVGFEDSVGAATAALLSSASPHGCSLLSASHARNPTSSLRVKSEKDAPEYFNPCDMFKLCAARGNFSVDSDKDKVNATLVTMLKAKSEWYAQLGDVTLARLIKVFGPCFVPREVYTSATAPFETVAAAAAAATVSKGAVADV